MVAAYQQHPGLAGKRLRHAPPGLDTGWQPSQQPRFDLISLPARENSIGREPSIRPWGDDGSAQGQHRTGPKDDK